jgi:hypothetical protein
MTSSPNNEYGIEKSALNALGKRVLAMTNPQLAVKKFGHNKTDAFLKDIQTAANNAKKYKSNNMSVRAEFSRAAASTDPGEKNAFRYLRKELAPTLQDDYGIVPRQDLIKRLNEVVPEYDTSKLSHSQYVVGYPLHRINDKDILLGATKLPYTDPMHLPVQHSVLRDLYLTRTLPTHKNQPMSRSVEKALASIEGQNAFEPGTRAYRMAKKIYARPQLRKKLGLPNKLKLLQYKAGLNAFYDPALNVIAVSPRFGKHYNTVKAHELGHLLSHTAPADQHAEHAYKTLRRMHAVAKRNKFNLPLNDENLMQEALAESYIPKILGKEVTAPRLSPISTALADIGSLPSVLTNRKNFFSMSRNRHAINHMKGTESDKELFRQLALNYGYNLL